MFKRPSPGWRRSWLRPWLEWKTDIHMVALFHWRYGTAYRPVGSSEVADEAMHITDVER